MTKNISANFNNKKATKPFSRAEVLAPDAKSGREFACRFSFKKKIKKRERERVLIYFEMRIKAKKKNLFFSFLLKKGKIGFSFV